MTISASLFEESRKYIPGGVNSPVRAFKSVGGSPLFIKKAAGSKLYDEDGNEYIDYICSWGPMILGHLHPFVVKAVQDQLSYGFSFGAPTRLELEMAKLISKMVKPAEMVRMVNSGTEATMSAIRVGRGYTGKDKIVKFDGCYHGHSDSLLVKAGSGVETLSLPDSPGVPESIANLTISVPFNDPAKLEEKLSTDDNIALVIIEPVIGNMGLILPDDGFLLKVRELTSKYNVLLIFDEVMTGFRLSSGGASKLYNVTPDLITLGKVIGGGFPVGAYAGKKEIMSHVAPEGSIYQAGTLSGSPLAMAAGLATLGYIDKNPDVYDQLDKQAKRLVSGILKISKEKSIPILADSVGSMFGFYFTDKVEKVRNYKDAKTADTKFFAEFHQRMLKNGVYLAPSQFESGFISIAHSDDDINKTLEAMRKSL